MKTCIDCGESKSESEFHRSPSNLDGIRGSCRSCTAKYWKKWNTSNSEQARIARLKHKYGLTEDEYKALPDRCEICSGQKKLCIDHDHNFGFIRGVLCDNCNKSLGFFHHDPELLKRAILYLEGTLAQTPTSSTDP